jgi:DNA polymerase-3 subunit alpha
MGFIDYILLVHSYANQTKRRGIARGSGGGSLICYLTGITQIDPVEHGLLFERFIDVGQLQALEAGEIDRSELKVPDIYLDFATDTLSDILHFLYERYGEDKVASIGRFGTNKTKGTIRDMCKVLDIDLKEADKISKAFEDYEIDDIDSMIGGDISTPTSANIAIGYVMRYGKLFQYVRKLNGLPKSFGLHPCGRIVAVNDLDNYLPSCYDSDGVRYLQGDMHDTDSVGLVKIDVLGLRTLNQEHETHELSGESGEFLSTKQAMDDDKVMQLFRNTDTVGIFQFSSKGMQETLKKMRVKNLHDLAVANALYRPGPMQYIEEYCARRNGRVPVDFIHPDLEPILSSTYGIMVFQEQLIQIGRMAGLHNPDLLRKATGKKDAKLMAKIRPELSEGLRLRGWSDRQISKLWQDMVEFSAYSFNKSHSYAYSMLAYLTAKQKTYYPVEFFVGLLNSYIGESSFVKDNADEIITDVYKHGINILPFDYRQDHRRCSVKDGAILYAIPLIKGFSQTVADQVYYASGMQLSHFWRLLKHLSENGTNTSQMATLIRLGFFKAFGSEAALERIASLYDIFCGAKTLDAKYGDDSPIGKIVRRHTSNIGKTGKTLKRLTILDADALMDEVEAECINNTDLAYTYKQRADFQKEVLGFVSLLTGEQADRPILYIKGVYPAKRKSDGQLFGHNIIAQSIGSGITTRYTIFNRTFDKDPVETGDIIKCTGYERNGIYYNMTAYLRLA